MKTMRLSSLTTWYAPIACVIPPASRVATLDDRIASSSDVLPWSTCPMIVTTGGRISTSSRTSSCSTSRTTSSSNVNSVAVAPKYAAISLILSRSRGWLMFANCPFSTSDRIIRLALMPSFSATSLTVVPSEAKISVFGARGISALRLRFWNLLSRSASRSRFFRWGGRGRRKNGGRRPGGPGRPGSPGRPGKPGRGL